MTSTTHWQEIRALRARPTGLAANDPDRRNTYVAALRQAQELASAAATDDYASRALPLFYSLSQAGRAIAAAHHPSTWKLASHGLSTVSSASPLLNRLMAPKPLKVKPQSIETDSFGGVTQAIGSPVLAGKAELGALWAANPDLRDVPIPVMFGSWPRGVEVPIGHERLPIQSGMPTDPAQWPMSTAGHIAVSLDVPGVTGRDLGAALQAYPTLRGGFGIMQGPVGALPAGPNDVVVRGPDHDGVMRAGVAKPFPVQTNRADYWSGIRSFASYVEDHRDRHGNLVGHALPEIAGGPCPHPLMLWWALLLGLSSLTRYESAEWVRAIDVDESELAVSLERVLDIAAERIPKRILDCL